MLILGLCVAHDAGVALVDNGQVVGLVQRERWDRKKRSALVTPEFLEHALAQLGAAWRDIDLVAIASTQSWPFILSDPERLWFGFDPSGLESLPIDLPLKRAGPRMVQAFEVHRRQTETRLQAIRAGLYNEYLPIDPTVIDENRNLSISVEWPAYARQWVRRIANGKDAPAPDTAAIIAHSLATGPRSVGYAPATTVFDGVSKPSVIVPHQSRPCGLRLLPERRGPCRDRDS
jgi:carbamoyltransferase